MALVMIKGDDGLWSQTYDTPHEAKQHAYNVLRDHRHFADVHGLSRPRLLWSNACQRKYKLAGSETMVMYL